LDLPSFLEFVGILLKKFIDENMISRIEMRHSPILDQLRGGDRRSIGRVPQVVEEVSKNLELVGELVVGLVSDDPIIRMRAADALEKVSKGHPALLNPFKDILLNAAADSEQQEVRWHMAQMLPRLKLSQKENEGVVSILSVYLGDRSSIVKVSAMQALVEFAINDPRLISSVKPVIERACRSGTPAMRVRGRKLIPLLKNG